MEHGKFALTIPIPLKMKLSELIKQASMAIEKYGDMDCHGFYAEDAYEYRFGAGNTFCLRIIRSDAGDAQALPGASMTEADSKPSSVKATAVLFWE